jgi:hypothetical protein
MIVVMLGVVVTGLFKEFVEVAAGVVEVVEAPDPVFPEVPEVAESPEAVLSFVLAVTPEPLLEPVPLEEPVADELVPFVTGGGVEDDLEACAACCAAAAADCWAVC